MSRRPVTRSEAGRSTALYPAGWTLRYFNLDEFVSLLSQCPAALVEISKDFLRDAISLKALSRELDRLRGERGFALSYAGTTDFVSCADLTWQRYRRYVAVQAAEAKFLDCSLFRAFVGNSRPGVAESDVIVRLSDFCDDMHPIEVAVEIDGGMESNLSVLEHLLDETPAKVVIDFENMTRSGIHTEDMFRAVPPDRIAYFHQRNLPGVWTEHQASLADETEWRGRVPGGLFLWESKELVKPDVIRETFLEYRATA
jgi:hypothetical protein